MRTIDKIITPVLGEFTGRPNKGGDPVSGKIYDCAVPMKGDYDKGGAYWGRGNQLRVRYKRDLSYIEFYRLGERQIPIPERMI